MFANTNGFSLNLQIGLNPTAQNGSLNNICHFTDTAAAIISFTTTWVQTSVANVYYSAVGPATYQFVQANYVRIA